MKNNESSERLEPLVVAQRFGVSLETVYRWCRLKRISHYRLGGKITFDPQVVEEFLRASEIKADPEAWK
jgi:excisionase family DNA binding protein